MSIILLFYCSAFHFHSFWGIDLHELTLHEENEFLKTYRDSLGTTAILL